MIKERIIVVGASGFGRESLDTLEAMQEAGASIQIVGVVDDHPSELNLSRLAERGTKYLGSLDSWLSSTYPPHRYVLGIGNPAVRENLVEKLEMHHLKPFTAIHPKAVIGKNTSVGPGAVICANATISTNVTAGAHVHINPAATIGHDSVLSDFVSINPAAVISGEVEIGKRVLVGASSVILQQLTVGMDSVVGAASLVTKDVPEGVIVTGIPGRWTNPR